MPTRVELNEMYAASSHLKVVEAEVVALKSERKELRAKLKQQTEMVEKCMVAMNENAERGEKAEKERDALKKQEHGFSIQQRAEELVNKGFMPWREAEELALSERGIGSAEIVELQGNCTSSDFITGDDIPAFIRSVLVHGIHLLASVSSSPATLSSVQGAQSLPSGQVWQCAKCKQAVKSGYTCLCGCDEAEPLEAAKDSDELPLVFCECANCANGFPCKVDFHTDGDAHENTTSTC